MSKTLYLPETLDGFILRTGSDTCSECKETKYCEWLIGVQKHIATNDVTPDTVIEERIALCIDCIQKYERELS